MLAGFARAGGPAFSLGAEGWPGRSMPTWGGSSEGEQGAAVVEDLVLCDGEDAGTHARRHVRA